VIRRPTPRLIANPGPAVVRLPDPVAIAIRNPSHRLIRNPDIAIVRLVLPTSVGVQIFGSGVVAVGVLPRLRGVNHVITVAVPAVPIVAVRSVGNLVLSLLSGSANRRHFAFLQFGDTLRRGNLSFTFSHDDDRVAVRAYLNAQVYILVRGMYGDVRCIDLRLGLAFIEHAVISQPLRELNLDVILGEGCKICFGARSQTENIGEVELYFGASPRAS
jgi:hypothetical protein